MPADDELDLGLVPGTSIRPRRGRTRSPDPGDPCDEHLLQHPVDDVPLQAVLAWLRDRGDLAPLFGAAVHEAVHYVLDGSRTWRFDLNQPEVDSDERASVGTKLQYRLIERLGLVKSRPLDVVIGGYPVDIKGTVRSNWSVPEEAFCQLCICVAINAAKDTHQAWLMRTHRAWLYGGRGNKDKKRGIQADALNRFAVALYPQSALPVNPLKLLDADQRAAVFDLRDGQQTRLLRLFEFLPNVVIPRDAIITVCAQRDDPMRRARAIKAEAARRGMTLLVGVWEEDVTRARELGFDLSGRAWVGVRGISEQTSGSREPNSR